jgi:hypothetical protein
MRFVGVLHQQKDVDAANKNFLDKARDEGAQSKDAQR